MNTRTCEVCGAEYAPASAIQKYCAKCRPIVVKETKRRHYMKYHPNAYKEREKHFCVKCGSKAAGQINGVWYCNLHWQRMHYHGTTELLEKKSKNTYEVDGAVAKCKTANGREFLLDAEDVERCLKHSWCYDTRGYLAATLPGCIHATLHRFVLGLSDGDGITVDHINGDRGDNRKCNLRLCTQKENARNLKRKKNNTSGYPGVGGLKNGRFKACIMVDGISKTLGAFDTFEEAKKVRIEAELKYFGEFSPSFSRGVL